MEKYGSLILCVLATTAMMAGVRETKRWGLDLLQVTTFNYFTAVALGLCFSPSAHYQVAVANPEVLPVAIVLGTSFIFLFMVMGIVTRIAGITYMAFIAKMALMIPVLFSWWYYGEPLTPMRIAGVLTALISVMLISYRGKTQADHPVKGGGLLVALSVILFFGNGLNDSLFKYFSTEFKGRVTDEDFAIFVFTVAGTLGLVAVIFNAVTGRATFSWKNVLGGICVGLPNYFSLIFLTKGLQHMDGTVFFPVNNIGILLAAGLTGLLIYHERFKLINYLGMGVAIASIALMV